MIKFTTNKTINIANEFINEVSKMSNRQQIYHQLLFKLLTPCENGEKNNAIR